MSYELPRLVSGGGKTDPENSVIQAALKHDQQVFTSDTLLLFGLFEEKPELLFEHPVHALYFLLLPQLDRVIRLFFKSRLTMLTRSERPSLKGAFIREATVTLMIKLQVLSSATTADSTSISSQFRPPFD